MKVCCDAVIFIDRFSSAKCAKCRDENIFTHKIILKANDTNLGKFQLWQNLTKLYASTTKSNANTVREEK